MPRNYLYCVEWGVKLYSLTRDITRALKQFVIPSVRQKKRFFASVVWVQLLYFREDTIHVKNYPCLAADVFFCSFLNR